jgi:hypothetical protein
MAPDEVLNRVRAVYKEPYPVPVLVVIASEVGTDPETVELRTNLV